MAEGLCTSSFMSVLGKWQKKAAALTSICQVPRGMAFSPKFLRRNWWPRVVWSIISVYKGEASSCMHQAPCQWQASQPKLQLQEDKTSLGALTLMNSS